jgi:RimJ/RimL family protein N-acetyltransferase
MSLALKKLKPKVSLALITADQIHKIRGWANDPYFEEYFRRYPPEFLWGDDQAVANMHCTSYFIRVDDEIVGMCALASFDLVNKSVEYGLLMEKDCPEKVKVIFESGELIKNYVFDYMDYKRIWTRTLANRKNIARLLRIGGLVFEGTSRKSVFWKNEFHDEWIFSLIKGEE